MMLPDEFPDLAPGETMRLSISDHEFEINTRAIHSDRRRYLVVCVTCGNELVHPSTTGPGQQAEYHVRHTLGER